MVGTVSVCASFFTVAAWLSFWKDAQKVIQAVMLDFR